MGFIIEYIISFIILICFIGFIGVLIESGVGIVYFIAIIIVAPFALYIFYHLMAKQEIDEIKRGLKKTEKENDYLLTPEKLDKKIIKHYEKVQRQETKSRKVRFDKLDQQEKRNKKIVKNNMIKCEYCFKLRDEKDIGGYVNGKPMCKYCIVVTKETHGTWSRKNREEIERTKPELIKCESCFKLMQDIHIEGYVNNKPICKSCIQYYPRFGKIKDKIREDKEKNQIEMRKQEEEQKKDVQKQLEQHDLESLILMGYEPGNKGNKYINRTHKRYVSSTVRKAVWKRDKGRCVRCGGKENIQFDHIIPISKGGSSTVENIELLCQSCNIEKLDKIE